MSPAKTVSLDLKVIPVMMDLKEVVAKKVLPEISEFLVPRVRRVHEAVKVKLVPEASVDRKVIQEWMEKTETLAQRANKVLEDHVGWMVIVAKLVLMAPMAQQGHLDLKAHPVQLALPAHLDLVDHKAQLDLMANVE